MFCNTGHKGHTLNVHIDLTISQFPHERGLQNMCSNWGGYWLDQQLKKCNKERFLPCLLFC